MNSSPRHNPDGNIYICMKPRDLSLRLILMMHVLDQFPNTEKIGSVCHERFIPETIMRG